MANTLIQKLIATGTVVAGLAVASAAQAVTLNGFVGGLPQPTAGGTIIYDNLNSYTVQGDGSWLFSSGVRVTFDPDPGSGGHVTGSQAGQYAAPFLSNSNGVPFGDNTVAGQDTTPYLSTGSYNDRLIIDLPGDMQFFGLLWGSVDAYNTIEFWDFGGSGLLDTFTGADVTAAANGNQGAEGTFYVNINSDTTFNRVVLYSSSFSFEFDNISYSEKPAIVPSEVSEPAALGVLGLSLLGLGLAARRRKFA